MRVSNLRRQLLACVPAFCAAAVVDAVGPAGIAGAAPNKLRISTRTYTPPDVKLVREDGTPVSLDGELNDGRPVALNFIFTSCGAICPLMTQVFAEFQRKLGPESANLHIISISIDPEQDTPARLREYAQQFHAGPGWNFYTGTDAASVTTQKAFNVYRGDKMSHTAVTLLRASPGASWRRIDGLATPDEMVSEYHLAMAGK